VMSPLAQLRASTRQWHGRLEALPFMQALVKGTVSRAAYCRYLETLLPIYTALEESLASLETSTYPELAAFDQPVLRRRKVLAEDIAFLRAGEPGQGGTVEHSQTPLEKGASNATAVPHAQASHGTRGSVDPGLSGAAPPVGSGALVDADNVLSRRIRSWRRDQPHKLAAAVYVRYLGDLSGGQIVQNRLKQTLGLPDHRGLAFYRFETPSISGLATKLKMQLNDLPLTDATGESLGQAAAECFADHQALLKPLAVSLVSEGLPTAGSVNAQIRGGDAVAANPTAEPPWGAATKPPTNNPVEPRR